MVQKRLADMATRIYVADSMGTPQARPIAFAP
jgi:hypothetical protein